MINYKQMPIYLCSFTKEWNKIVKSAGKIAKHVFSEINDKTIIWPEKIDSVTIAPENFNELKKHHNIKELLIIDRIIGTNRPVSIINHVNRSGQNFLRNETPFEEYPQFPDMSKIYHKINGLDTAVVHTIGIKRFQNIPSDAKVVWSELVGLIAPVAHYVGIKVFAIGGNKIDDIIKIL